MIVSPPLIYAYNSIPFWTNNFQDLHARINRAFLPRLLPNTVIQMSQTLHMYNTFLWWRNAFRPSLGHDLLFVWISSKNVGFRFILLRFSFDRSMLILAYRQISKKCIIFSTQYSINPMIECIDTFSHVPFVLSSRIVLARLSELLNTALQDQTNLNNCGSDVGHSICWMRFPVG